MPGQAQQPQTKNVTLSNGLRMRYYEWPGRGPVLVFLHPSSGYGCMWDETARLLTGDLHIYALDQRGHGDTDKPIGSYSAEEYAQDLLLFLEALAIPKAMIAGHSLGGRVAQAFAGTYPELAQALLLVGGPHYSNFVQTPELVDRVLQGVEAMRTSVTEFPSIEAAHAYLQQTRPTYPEAAVQSMVTHNMRQQPDGGVVVKYDKLRVAQGLTHMTDDLRAYARRVICPVAILRGRHDDHLPRQQAEEMASYWRDCRIIEVECSYAPEIENPAGLAQAIQEFVKTAVPALREAH